MVNFNGVLYVPQEVNNLLSVLRLISKGAKMGFTKYNMAIKKNGISMIMDARKGKMGAQWFT